MQEFLSISLLILLVAISPGPDSAIVTKNSLLTHEHVKAGLNRVQYYMVKAMGVLLVAFGVRIATLSQASTLPTSVMA